MDNQISCCSSVAVKSLHTLTTECDQRSMLCSCLDDNIFFAEYREIESPFDTECCLRWRYVDRVVEICPFATESTLVFWNCECDIEITIAMSSFITFTSDFDGHTIFDALRDIDRLFGFFFDFSLTMTVATLPLHHEHARACSITPNTVCTRSRTCPCQRQVLQVSV
jgi:hypothetical protein